MALMQQLAGEELPASMASDWLLDRTMLLQSVGPKMVDQYRLLVPRTQIRAVQWILLGAMPGGILLFGGLVWLRRRK